MWHDWVTGEEQILNSVLKLEKICVFGSVSGAVALYCCSVAFGRFESNQVMKYSETLLRCFWNDPAD